MSDSPKTDPDHQSHAEDAGAADQSADAAGAEPTPATGEAGDLFDLNSTFADLGLRNSVQSGLEKAGFERPTSIQAKLIPPILAGKDVIGQARTGTGKTAAFGLPILHKADKDTPMQALILTPTRELAAQVTAELEELGRFTPIDIACIVGGESMRAQEKAIKGGAQILVGTPGRIMDLYGRKQIHFKNVQWAVLDEVDRMLDIGFRDDIKKILGQITNDHQTVFCSATLSDEIERLSRRFMKEDAEKITTVSGSLTVSLVDQKYLPVEPWDKKQLILHLLKKEQPEAALVFCRTKATVHKLTDYLRNHDISAREIHGDLHQSKRNRAMEALRKGKIDVLIASDLAARGLDIEHITHVINYDLPDDPEIYIHRIGRTARAGRTGKAWSFVTPEQGQLLTEIEKLTGVMIEKLVYPDFKPGPVPEDIAAEREKEAKRRSQTQEVSLGDTLSQRATGPDLSGMDEQELKRRFPQGKIPKTKPRKNLGSRLRSRRR